MEVVVFVSAESSKATRRTRADACLLGATVSVFAFVLEGEGFVGWATLFLCGPVTSPEGREGWNLRGATVINSPFNNSCPTWPAGPRQCPLCIYTYVYLCIHSMQEITTAGVQSLFFSRVAGDCFALGRRIAHLNSFNPPVDLLIRGCGNTLMDVAMTLSLQWEHTFYLWMLGKNANLHFLRTYSVTFVSGNATVIAFLVLNGPVI